MVVVLLDVADQFLIQAAHHVLLCLLSPVVHQGRSNPAVQKALDIDSKFPFVIEIDLLEFRQVP